jgi:hypothetical protein
VVVDPTPSNTGTLDLTLTSTKIAMLKDAAGNPATVTTAAEVSHDTIAPTTTFTNKGPNVVNAPEGAFYIGNLSALNGYQIGFTVPSDTQTPITKATFSDRPLDTSNITLSSGSGDLFVDKDYIDTLSAGIYTVTVETTDTAGNTGINQQLVIKNNSAGTLAVGAFAQLDTNTWIASGNDQANFFINRRDDVANSKTDTMDLGNQSPTDASDQVFFTKTGLGSLGQADQALIKNFDTSVDLININDLFDQSPQKSLNAYVRFETLNLDGSADDSKESTKIYISTQGTFTNDASTWQNQSEQVIVVQDVVWDNNNQKPDWLIVI